MKKLFLITSFLAILFLLGKAQEDYQYVPIADNAEWSVNTIKFRTNGDTIINEKSYLKVYQQANWLYFDFDLSQADYYCALRNDTLNKRVYVVYPTYFSIPIFVYDYLSGDFLFHATDTTEFLLYDFSLNIGDTISIYENEGSTLYRVKMTRVEEVALYGSMNGSYNDLIYSNSDSIQVLENGDFRKRILMETTHPYGTSYDSPSTVWIEGIGSMHGLTRQFRTDFYAACTGDWKLLCYSNEYELLLSTHWNINENCFRIPEGVSIKENNVNTYFKLYPNPSNRIIKIESIENIELNNCKIDLIDLLGRIVYSSNFYNSMELDVSSYPDGLYFVQITQQNKSLFNGKIVIQK